MVFSVPEILNKNCSNLKSSQLEQLRLKLSDYSHPFPYGLSVTSDVMQKVRFQMVFIQDSLN